MTSGRNLPDGYRPSPTSLQQLLQSYLFSGHLIEVVYRDEAGQIQTVHDVVRDFFVRAGQEFLMLGRGQTVRMDHLLVLDGLVINNA